MDNTILAASRRQPGNGGLADKQVTYDQLAIAPDQGAPDPATAFKSLPAALSTY
ncbi:MAG: hypothetical protein IPH23_14735 [Gammaproteobacteria bacterium]|nr:hypothetical protein [Gammaproteobacteria bacterium]